MAMVPIPQHATGNDVPASDVADTTWRCLILVELANFAILRRHLGRARTGDAVDRVAAAIETLLPDRLYITRSGERIEVGLIAPAPDAFGHLMARIEAAFDPPFLIDGEPFTVDMAVAASTMPSAIVDDLRMIEEAEQALHEARIERKPICRKVLSDVGSFDRIALSRDLTQAISAGEMFLHYQPKIHLRKQAITSVEALIRWRHPIRGQISPADFIPIAEESRDIVALTLWTIRQVIADQRVMKARGCELRVFINIAAALLADARFVGRACELVEEGGTSIGFEVTETSVIRDPDSAIAHLKMFAAMGIDIAIDDYGAGLSSLAYLKKLPARELKIDKLFVTHLSSSNRDPLIVRSTIDLAHALDMEVVAEGVETPSSLALLSVMGCDMAQGYLISRPLELSALLDFVETYDVATPMPPMLSSLRLLGAQEAVGR